MSPSELLASPSELSDIPSATAEPWSSNPSSVGARVWWELAWAHCECAPTVEAHSTPLPHTSAGSSRPSPFSVPAVPSTALPPGMWRRHPRPKEQQGSLPLGVQVRPPACPLSMRIADGEPAGLQRCTRSVSSPWGFEPPHPESNSKDWILKCLQGEPVLSRPV